MSDPPKILLRSMLRSLPLCFPLCVHNFRSSVHILIHFVYGVREESNFIVLHVAISFFNTICWNCPEQLNSSFLIPTPKDRICFGKLYQLFKCWNSFIFFLKIHSVCLAKHIGTFHSDGGLPFRSVSMTLFLTSFRGLSNIIDFWIYMLI